MATAGYVHRTTCRLCDAAALSRVLSIPWTPPANEFVKDAETPQTEYPLDLMLCAICGHTQLSAVVDPKLLFQGDAGGYAYRTGDTPALVEHFRHLAATLMAQMGLAHGDLVCEIGGNDGTLLDYFHQAGMFTANIEPAGNLAKLANEKSVYTLPRFFDDRAVDFLLKTGVPVAGPKQAKLVLATNVFAHIDDLSGVVENVKRLLTEDGWFVFEVADGLTQVRNGTFDSVMYHEHLSTHSVRPLRRFFERHGMTLFDVREISTHGGSLRGYVCQGSNRVETSKVQERVDLEFVQRLFDPGTYRALELRIQRGKRELHELIERGRWAALNGNSAEPLWAGYGAPAKMTPFCYALGLGTGEIRYVVDDSPLKQGRYSPGKHIPVVASTELFKRRPEYLVIFPWNLSEQLVAKVRGMFAVQRMDAPKFVVAFPTLRVIE